MPDFLEVKDLKIYYETSSNPVRAVDGVSFSVEKKQIIGVVGESGCGKSTLAMGILKLIKPPCYVAAGKILLDNIDLLKLNEEETRKLRYKRFSYIPQSAMNALNPIMKIKNQIIDGIVSHEDVARNEIEKTISKLIERVGLPPETANMYPHELSGGMRQRAAIAIALALNPDFVIADEPTTALDVVVQRAVLEFLVSLKRSYDSTLMIITHDMAVAAEVCDRLAVMYAGKILEIGSIYDVFEKPLHPYSRRLIDSVPSITGKKELKSLSGSPPDLINPPIGCKFRPRCPEFDPARCKEDEEPILIEGMPGHCVACHLY